MWIEQEIQQCSLLLKKQNKLDFYQYKMTQYNNLNVKLSNSQLNKLKSAIESEVVLRLPSNMIGDSDDKINFPHELLLTNRQVAIFVKPLQIIQQLILSYQKLNYLRWYNQKDFLVDFLAHYLKQDCR